MYTLKALVINEQVPYNQSEYQLAEKQMKTVSSSNSCTH